MNFTAGAIPWASVGRIVCEHGRQDISYRNNYLHNYYFSPGLMLRHGARSLIVDKFVALSFNLDINL